MAKLTNILPVFALGALASCATPTTDTSASAKDSVEDVRVGQKVDRICFSRGISGFTEWKGGDGLIIRRGARQEFLVLFDRSCAPLDNAARIGVDDRFGSGCLRRSDSIIVSNTLFPTQNETSFDTDRCQIRGIYEWDENAGVDEEKTE